MGYRYRIPHWRLHLRFGIIGTPGFISSVARTTNMSASLNPPNISTLSFMVIPVLTSTHSAFPLFKRITNRFSRLVATAVAGTRNDFSFLPNFKVALANIPDFNWLPVLGYINSHVSVLLA